jgi:outer membrane protein TolC
MAQGFVPATVLAILLDKRSADVSNASQKRALKNYRNRLNERGMARFEVLGLHADRELVRSLARRLAENDSAAAEIRATLRRAISGEPPKKGGILNALRRSPLVGANLDVNRLVTHGRKVDL